MLLMRLASQFLFEHLSGDGDVIRMCHPGSVKACVGFSLLVIAHRCQSGLIYSRILSAGNECCHAAHSVSAPLVAGFHYLLTVCLHEWHSHCHLRSVRQEEAL